MHLFKTCAISLAFAAMGSAQSISAAERLDDILTDLATRWRSVGVHAGDVAEASIDAPIELTFRNIGYSISLSVAATVVEGQVPPPTQKPLCSKINSELADNERSALATLTSKAQVLASTDYPRTMAKILDAALGDQITFFTHAGTLLPTCADDLSTTANSLKTELTKTIAAFSP